MPETVMPEPRELDDEALRLLQEGDIRSVITPDLSAEIFKKVGAPNMSEWLVLGMVGMLTKLGTQITRITNEEGAGKIPAQFSPATFSRALMRLNKKGLVKVTGYSARRVIELTADGLSAFKYTYDQIPERERVAFDCF